MKRTTGLGLVLTVLSGCMTMAEPRTDVCQGHCGVARAPMVPGMQGPMGEPVAMAAPYTSMGPTGADAARAMMAQSVPLELVQAAGAMGPGMPSGVLPAGGNMAAGMPSGIIPAGGGCPPGGCAPPMMPPSGGLSPPGMPFAPGLGIPGAVAAVGAITGPTPQRFPAKRTEVRFLSPAGMKISWYAPSSDGRTGFSAAQLEVPGRYNFIQAAIYRLKLGDIPNRPGLELYPTLEVVPSNHKTDPFLAHSAVPITFTDEDFDQVAAGNYVVKVIYLPDPQFQDLAVTGPDEVVSSRLEPGVDPIVEAQRRGSILLIARIGNIDLEAPNTPSMDAPSAFQPRMPFPPPGLPLGGAPPCMPPPGAMMPGGPMGAPPAGMTPNAPMMRGPGNVMMGPNGLMMVTPNTPMMMTANGPLIMVPANPPANGLMAQPGMMLPANGVAQPTVPLDGPAPPESGETVSQPPSAQEIQQVQQKDPKEPAAAVPAPSGPKAKPAPAKKRWPHLW